MKQGEIWLINLDPTVGAEVKPHYQKHNQLKMNKLHKKQVIAGLKDAKEGKVMDSETFWKKLNNA